MSRFCTERLVFLNKINHVVTQHVNSVVSHIPLRNDSVQRNKNGIPSAKGALLNKPLAIKRRNLGVRNKPDHNFDIKVESGNKTKMFFKPKGEFLSAWTRVEVALRANQR